MIKFYRKIRQNLLSEGKTGKYFKYAIGEIVLVVLGILIALSIKNWNENRKNNILKQTYINNLKIDLNTDTERLEGLIKFNDKYEKSGFYFLNYLENNLSEIDTIVLSRASRYTGVRFHIALIPYDTN